MTVAKNFFVILAFCILTIEFLVLAEVSKAQKQEWIDECSKQLNVTTEAEELVDPVQSGCFIACMIKKLGKNNETLYDILKLAIDEIQEIDPELYRELMDKLDKCWKEAPNDECQVIDCLNVFIDPFARLLSMRPSARN